METLLQSTRRTGVWMTSANCRAAAPVALLHASIKSMSQYSTCAYSIIIRLKLTAAAHRVLRTANNDLKVVRNNTVAQGVTNLTVMSLKI
jgi:hypothetical protein